MKRGISVVIVVLLFGCAAAGYRPLIDEREVDMNKYESDLKECQQTATTPRLAIGTFIGFFLSDRASDSANAVAQTAVNRCMAGRGYKGLPIN